MDYIKRTKDFFKFSQNAYKGIKFLTEIIASFAKTGYEQIYISLGRILTRFNRESFESFSRVPTSQTAELNNFPSLSVCTPSNGYFHVDASPSFDTTIGTDLEVEAFRLWQSIEQRVDELKVNGCSAK